MMSVSNSFYLKIALYVAVAFVLFLPKGLSAQLGGTAREYFVTAESAAESWNSDAELLYLLGGGEEMHIAGDALLWTYFFQSAGEDSIYMVLVSLGLVILEEEVLDSFSILQALPTNWIDSDVAVAVAEDNGGSDFRALTGSDIILATAGVGLYLLELDRAVWLFTYMDTTSTPAMLFVHVDAVTGEWLNTQELGVGDGADTGQPLPKTFALSQNYPNPFNPSTTLRFTVPAGAKSEITLDVFDVRGRRIRTLFRGKKDPGTHEVHWDGKNGEGANVVSGTYLVRLGAGQETIVRKMTLLK